MQSSLNISGAIQPSVPGTPERRLKLCLPTASFLQRPKSEIMALILPCALGMERRMLWGFRSLWTRRELQIHSELTTSNPSFLQGVVGPCQTSKYLLQSSKHSVFSYLRFSLKLLHNLSRDLHIPFSYEGQIAAPTWDFSLAKRILLPMLRECRCARPEAVCWSKVMGSRPRWAKSFCSTYCKRHIGKVTAQHLQDF